MKHTETLNSSMQS